MGDSATRHLHSRKSLCHQSKTCACLLMTVRLWQAGQEGGGLVVASLAGDGPADQSGQVLAGDLLVSIDRIDVRGMSAEDLAQYILGAPGTQVRLGFLRQGSEVRYVELTRGWTMKRSGLTFCRSLVRLLSFVLSFTCVLVRSRCVAPVRVGHSTFAVLSTTCLRRRKSNQRASDGKGLVTDTSLATHTVNARPISILSFLAFFSFLSPLLLLLSLTGGRTP